MFPDTLEKIQEYKWVSLTIQSSLLGLNVLLVSQGKVNSYILLSIAFVFSLFALQFVSPRIVYFHPFNSHIMRSTFHFDTFLLFMFTFLAGILFFLGIAATHKIEPLVCLDAKLKKHILWIFGVLAVVLPLYFKFFGRMQIRRSLAKRFRSKVFQYKDECNECGNAEATYENFILEWNDLRIRKVCEKCGNDKPKEFKTRYEIG